VLPKVVTELCRGVDDYYLFVGLFSKRNVILKFFVVNSIEVGFLFKEFVM